MTDDRDEKMQNVIDLMKANDLSAVDACREIGVSASNFYGWKSKNRLAKKHTKTVVKKQRSPSVQTIQIQQHDDPKEKVMCIIGQPAEIAEILRGLK